jgi:ATP/maltotriose-dependent transcriptional regulator MalT/DNA-binding SARP family transcriptional activator
MDAPVPILPTKIFVPRRRNDLLSRSRLIDALHELLEYKLIIIAAPAGYGKTSLVVDFAHHTEWPFCWYALDVLDREPIRFLSHLVASITMQFPLFGKRSRAVLQNMAEGELNLDTMVSAVIQDMFEAINEHFVIVLDDYHLIEESEPIAYFISRLVQDSDENCHVILTSRTLIALPDLPLMVARSLVGGLGAEDLAFTPQEVQAFFGQTLRQAIPESVAYELARLSEGWITGLLLSSQLADMGILDRLRRGRIASVGLYDYLATQVLERQPPELRDFLLHSSLLEEFDATECKEVIGEALGIQADWNALINTVLRENLFLTPVGEGRVWYRYHHLFADFLQQRLLAERPEEAERLVARLSERYRQQRAWERIYMLYRRLGRVDQTIPLLEEIGAELFEDGRLITLQQWLDELPETLFQQNPLLLSLKGNLCLIKGSVHEGLAYLDQSLNLYSEDQKIQRVETLVRRAAALRRIGEYNGALSDINEALSLVGDCPNSQKLFGITLQQKGIILYHQGYMREALATFEQSLRYFEGTAESNFIAFSLMEMGTINSALGNHLEAERLFSQATNHWLSTNNFVRLANVLNNLGDLKRQMGDYEGALVTLEKAVEYARQSSYLRMEAYALASIGDLYRDLGIWNSALEAYQQSNHIVGRLGDRFLSIYLQLNQAAMLDLQGQFIQAKPFLEQAWAMAEESGSAYEQNLCRLENGRFKLFNGNPALAIQDLQLAADFFESQGHTSEALRARLFLLLARWNLLPHTEDLRRDVLNFISSLINRDTPPGILSLVRESRPILLSLVNDDRLSGLVNELLVRLERFDVQLNVLRRRLRRQAATIPFIGPLLVIQTLGKIQIKLNNRVLTIGDWQTQSARDLFLYLLTRPDGVTREIVGNVFWRDCSPHELHLRFKNTLYRLRRAVGKDVVLFQDGIYRFNTDLDYEYDVEQFFREIYHAERSSDPRQKILHYQNALRYYQGPYLPGLDETWVLIERQRLFNAYTGVVLKLGELYLQQGDAQGALTCAQQLLQEDPCFEEAHRLAMQAYAAMGNRAAVVRQYDYCRRVLSEELNTAPSLQTQSLFEALIR